MAGQNERLCAAFVEHRSSLLQFLTRRVSSVALAEDLAQEAWLRAANSGVAAVLNLHAYVFRIAANLASDHSRQTRRQMEIRADPALVESVADPKASPELRLIERDELARVRRAVEELPPRCREVFLLHKVDGLRYKEIAQRLGIAKNTVMVHMVKALAFLEQRLQSGE